jgi:hypothetical protein
MSNYPPSATHVSTANNTTTSAENNSTSSAVQQFPASSFNSSGNLKLTSRRITELIQSIAGPNQGFDTEVETLLLELADDFVENVSAFSCALAKHRKSNQLEVRDILFHLEKNWNIKVPGYSNLNAAKPTATPLTEQKTGIIQDNSAESLINSLAPVRRPVITEGHKRRLALVQKFSRDYYQNQYNQNQANSQGNQSESLAESKEDGAENTESSIKLESTTTESAARNKRRREDVNSQQ